MANYWFWENVSPVRRLRDEYEELIEDLNNEIKRISENSNTIRSQLSSIHKTMKSYSRASGCMAELYYQKIEESEAYYRQVLASCEDVIATIRGRRNQAQDIRNTLQYYYQREQREDKEYTLRSIGL